MKEKENKRQTVKISIFITSIFVIFISVAYAFINQTLTGTKRQVITAGNLELELKENNEITLENALPMYDEIGMIQEAFTFRLTNNENEKVNYVLKLKDITTGEKLSANIVKYGLTKDDISNIDVLDNLVNGQIDNGAINGNQTINYSLRLWIDSSVEDETLIKDKTLSYKLEVEVSQSREIKGMLKAVVCNHENDEYPTDNYWQYRENITSVIFENQIAVPENIGEDKKWDVSALNDQSVMAYVEENGTLSSGKVAYKLHIQGDKKIFANVDSSNLFAGFWFVEIIDGLEYLDTSNVENMSYMFYSMEHLNNLNLSKFDTSNVTNMAYMFYDCPRLISLDITSFNTDKVTNMSNMFQYLESITTLDVSGFNTSNVTDMSEMFYDCYISHLDLSNFDTKNVTNMSKMFCSMRKLVSLNLKNFDTSSVTNMQEMFYMASSLTDLDLSNFDTSNVTNMQSMFSECSSLTNLDLSGFDISNVAEYSWMFSSFPNTCLITVRDENTKNWILAKNNTLENVVVKTS